jgi:hypothetical protein
LNQFTVRLKTMLFPLLAFFLDEPLVLTVDFLPAQQINLIFGNKLKFNCQHDILETETLSDVSFLCEG